MTDNFDDLRDPNEPGERSEPGGTGNTPDPFGFDDLSSFDEPTFRDPGVDADLPDELGPAEPTTRSRTFILGLFGLIALLIVGLVLILFAAAQIGQDNENRRRTAEAIQATNNAVQTFVAGTATAKSWTLTPSNTPQPTFTPTFTPSVTLTPTLTPSVTLTPTAAPTLTFTPSATISGTPSITVVPPTATELPTLTRTAIPTQAGIPGTVAALSTLSAQFQSGLNGIAAQQTQNARLPTPRSASAFSTGTARAIQNQQFQAYSTFAYDQLTSIPLTVTALSIPTATPTSGAGSAPAAQGTVSPTPTPVGDLGGTPMGRQSDPRYMSALDRPLAQATPTISAANRTATSNADTISAIQMQIEQLQAASTANSFQATVNAVLNPGGTFSAPVQTQNARLEQGGTAIAVQLTLDAIRLQAFTQQPTVTRLPQSGLYEDLTSGGASPASLALFALAACGLVVLIVVARRLRVRE